ncbi:MAG: PAC2 family protein [Nitrososphaerota archaeon]|nr:PAC2 family protein [Nitrososphaerota archaeon]MDG6978883.1 PAC2 family protein [Nitrososphaerota archaeon]MDG7005627.1 PAC2 family protein [Nitrososphaerota archaeon]MDG7020431.1 PAC2 family protein [Nitrososphaerota archaeon]
MWERLEVEGAPAAEESTLLVCLSTMAPQYVPLYSHARELAGFLLKNVDSKVLATHYSSSLPAAVTIEQEGVARLYSNQFRAIRGRKRIIVLSGDGSPFDDQQDFAHSALSFAARLGATEVVSVGARWAETPAPPGSPLRPVGYATDAAGVKELEGYGVAITRGEPGPFFPNLVVGMAPDYGMRGFKLGVDHGEPLPHPRSVMLILGVLSKMLGLEVETKALEARAKEMESEGGHGLPEVGRERSGIYG